MVLLLLKSVVRYEDESLHRILRGGGSGFETIRHVGGAIKAFGGNAGYLFHESGVYKILCEDLGYGISETISYGSHSRKLQLC